MLFGLIVRPGAFAINAGLVFLLSQQVPELDWWNVRAQSTPFENTRNTILAGLDRVRADLAANGKLLFRDRQAGGATSMAGAGRAEDLDRRAPRTVHITD
jgi:hypothetical protein